jgi:hypothetical protein
MEFDNDRPVKRPYRIEILYWILLGLMNPLVTSLTIFLHDAKMWAVVLLINLFHPARLLVLFDDDCAEILVSKKVRSVFCLERTVFDQSAVYIIFYLLTYIEIFAVAEEQSYFTYTDGTIIRENLVDCY